MIVLGIESSCDECSIALVENGRTIIALQTHSQIESHIQHNGVVPELASRLHVQHIALLYKRLLQDCKNIYGRRNDNKHSDENEAYLAVDGIAVSVCPGLRGSLLVGLQFAKGLALGLDIPFVGIDHVKAHFYSACMEHVIGYPYIATVVSGGHTVIAIVHDFDTIEVKGTSLDDSCGETFDKVARELGFDYPGGAQLDACAKFGDINAAQFPQCSVQTYGYDMSYSGLKTATIHYRDKYWNTNFTQNKENIAASFRFAAIEMIVERIEMLVKETGISTVAFGGGVASNSYLRKRMQNSKHICAMFPSMKLCVDNGAMIAGLGYEYLSRNIHSTVDSIVSSRNHLFKRIENKNILR